MGYRRRIARAPRCSLRLFRAARDQGSQALATYLKTCGPPVLVPRKVKRPKTGPSR